MVTDYTNVNTENSSVCVYVRARPPDPSWTLQDDDASIEDKFQNPLQATLAGSSWEYYSQRGEERVETFEIV